MARPPARRQAFLGRLAQLPRAHVVDEIVRNLGFVFNTRKACGSVLPEFGLGDYERELNPQRAAHTVRAELLVQVRRHEPRIATPAVELCGRHGYNMVRYELTGAVDGQPLALGIDIDTTTREVIVHIPGLR